MKASKVTFLIFLTMISLCIVNTQPVKSQNNEIIYLQGEGSISTSTNATVPIQWVGDAFTLTDNIQNYSISILSDNIVVDGAGYTLYATGDIGIDLSYRSDVTIKNIRIESTVYGIYLWNSTRNTVSGNTLSYNVYGIHILEASQNSIIGNSIIDNGFGIILDKSSNNILRNNILDSNNNLVVYGGEASHFDNDIDNSNIVNGKKAYYLVGERNLVINPSTYPDVGYLALVNCQNITVEYLELVNNGHGLLLAFTTGSTVSQNDITANSIGIGLFSASDNFIIDNNIVDNFRGIQFSNSSNRNSISLNNITRNTEGMFLFNSVQNSITSNNITNNDIGIGFKRSSNNMIRGNFFISNEEQVYDMNNDDTTIPISTNIWDFSFQLGGNYWSDYTGVDIKSGAGQNLTGSDGKGDTPYTIYGNNIDKFPLMPYGSPSAISIISPQNKTYTTTDILINYIASDPSSLIKYSLDGQANVTINEPTTLRGLALGVHSLTVYSQDTDGKTGISETIYFTISQGTEPTQSEPFPTTWIAVIVVIVAVGVALLYFLKIKKK